MLPEATVAFTCPLHAAGQLYLHGGDEFSPPTFRANAVSAVAGIGIIGVGVAVCTISFVVRRAMASKAAPGDEGVAARATAMIAAYGVSEGAAMLGLVWGFMTGTIGIPMILVGLSMMTGIRHFPTKAWLTGEAGAGKAW